jgi:uncharacterized protein YjiS (DUF1127 family)
MIVAQRRRQADGGLRQIVVKGWNACRVRRDQQQTLTVLQGLDDHQLKDIGLRRCEIESVVSSIDGDPTRRWRGGDFRPLNQPTELDTAA